MSPVPGIRVCTRNDAPLRAEGAYVLYWMIASRRVSYNFALDRALEYCARLRKPLVVFEALRCQYPWASDRIHRFVLEGMADNARVCAEHGVLYYPYVEPRPGTGKGLLRALAENACVVITDEFPCFFLPRMVRSAARKLPVLVEAVDSNGLLPIYAAGKAAERAFDFRRYLQRELPKHLEASPGKAPLDRAKLPPAPTLPARINSEWPAASPTLFLRSGFLDELPIDHQVEPARARGGHSAARRRLGEFLDKKAARYAEVHNEPDQDAGSGLSPYLHFGHISVHEVFADLAQREKWTPARAPRENGKREGWWNMSAGAEAFLDQLVTWRELGYNFAACHPGEDGFELLPEWARRTLEKHAKDEREKIYSREEFEAGGTHDELWNAAERQLVSEGRMHNYLRMLWGKKILEWTRTPEEAARIMIELNNKYALDGRDPNSYSGIFWVLGRYDRPWGPERPVFGTIRYMSSESTARKVSVERYIKRYRTEGARGGAG